ncbi:hypothetical protein [Haliangium sp.]|uniref:hypothetical protein n=1 Tax=Haliangium sp. TaxID=2663208 RepID=UPI003D0C08AD
MTKKLSLALSALALALCMSTLAMADLSANAQPAHVDAVSVADGASALTSLEIEAEMCVVADTLAENTPVAANGPSQFECIPGSECSFLGCGYHGECNTSTNRCECY